MSDDTLPLPRALTAENGAKAALSGEFFDTMNVTCPACCCGIVEDLTGERSACVECDGTGEISVKVPVAWTTIKAIWRRAVEHFEKRDREQADTCDNCGGGGILYEYESTAGDAACLDTVCAVCLEKLTSQPARED